MKKVTIEISEEEHKVLEDRVKGKEEFKSVEEYIQDIVSQVVDRLKDENKDDSISPDDEEKVKERLRNLGYLD